MLLSRTRPGTGRRGRRLTLRLARADVLMLVTMLIWSINISSVKVMVELLPPLSFGLLRYALASALLLALLAYRERPFAFGRADVVWIVAAGAVGLALNQVAFLSGIHLISASLAAILLAMTPLLTAAIAALWTREAVPARVRVSLPVSFVGVVVVIAGNGGPLGGSLWGAILILLSAAALGFGAVFAKRPLQRYSSLRVTAWMCLVCSLLLLPLGLGGLVHHASVLRAPLALGATSFTVIGATVLGNLTWNYAIQHIGAARTALYTYLQPVIGAIAAVILLSERLAATQIVGAAIVLLGLGLALATTTPTADVVATSAADISEGDSEETHMGTGLASLPASSANPTGGTTHQH